METEKTNQEKKKDIDDVLITSIDMCGKTGWIAPVAQLLKRYVLSDKVMIKGIEVLLENGWFDDVADLLKKEGLSDTVKAAAKKALEMRGVNIDGVLLTGETVKPPKERIEQPQKNGQKDKLRR
jgi:hypothetical protein